MIPQRTPRNDLAGSELRERVTACRKRLRNNRFTQSASGREFAEDSCAQKATFLDDDSAMRESLSSIELSSAALNVGNDTHEMLLTMGTQEAGIT
ncbi:MAG: hypothetical protein H0U60_02810 [Blastocatellia bacterium]|nr:hypothetical protein [Blastocatellia bacterium]